MITIVHNHQDGTVLYGSRRGDGVGEIVRPYTFVYRRSVGAFLIRGSRDRLARRHHIDGAAAALRAAGFEVTVEIDETPRERATVLAEQEARLADRREALEAKAARRHAEAAAYEEAVERVVRNRPPGQPILVGHHSETKARNVQRRLERDMHLKIDTSRAARELSRRAEAVGGQAEFSATPRATARRIERLVAELRDIDRKLDGYTRRFLGSDGRTVVQVEQHGPAEGSWRERLQARRTQLVDQLAYDRGLLEQAKAAGSYTEIGPGEVKPGDLVRVSGHWRRVVKVNRKTVSVETGYSWTDKVPFTKIDEVRSAGGEPQA